MEVGSIFLQVFLAVVIVIILLVIGFFVYNKDAMTAVVQAGKTQIMTPIFTGIKDLATSRNEVYNTLDGTNPLDPNYRNLGNAVNQQSGAEFTYNFWLYQDSTKAGLKAATTTAEAASKTARTFGSPTFGLNTDQLILFMRGDSRAVSYNTLCAPATKKDVYVKCPLVKLEKGGNVLTVEFNTVGSPEAVIENSRNICNQKSTNWDFINSYKIGVTNMSKYDQEWIMVTVVIQDTYPSDPLPIRNKARCTIYINGGVELDKYVDGKFNPKPSELSMVKQNQGDFYVAPQITYDTNKTTFLPATRALKGVCIADLTYYNYVPTSDDIQNWFARQFTKSYAPAYGNPTNQAQVSTTNNFMNNISMDTGSFKSGPIYSPSK